MKIAESNPVYKWPSSSRGMQDDLRAKSVNWLSGVNLVLSTVYQQPWHRLLSFSTLIGCNLHDESVRKILKTELPYEFSNGLQLQSMKDQLTVLQFKRKQILDNETFNLYKSWDVLGLAEKIKST